MRTRSRPASKAFLKALAESRKKHVASKLTKEAELPKQIRAFGICLRRREEYDHPFYSGTGFGGTINLAQDTDGTWRAVAFFRSCTVNPGLNSSSIKAALRNLRGHLQNLAIDLYRLGIERK